MASPEAFGPYVLLEPLGRGAMGDVFFARPVDPDRGVPTPIVIKRLLGDHAENEEFEQRFIHEAEFAMAVNDPHVEKIYDVGRVDGVLYLGIEFIAGWPITAMIDAHKSAGRAFDVNAALALVEDALSGLEAIHSAADVNTGQKLGLVHRDISPRNLMAGEDGTVRVIDFGLGWSALREWKTRTGALFGSIGYMPPEQVMSPRVSQAADLYAMGAVLFELLTLERYIQQASLREMLHASAQPVFRAPSSLRAGVPRGIDEIVRTSLDPDPARRFTSARAFRDALGEIGPRRNPAYSRVFVERLFGADMQRRRIYRAQLLDIAIDGVWDPGQVERTKSLARRTGVGPVAAPRPGTLKKSAALTAPGVPAAPLTQTVPVGSFMPPAPGTAVTGITGVTGVAPMLPARRTPWLAIAGAASACVISFFAGMIVERARGGDHALIVPITSGAPEPPARLTASPLVRADEAPPAAQEPAPPPEAAAAVTAERVVKKHAQAPAPRPAPPAPPAPPAGGGDAVTLDSAQSAANTLVRRADRLRGRFDQNDARFSALNALIANMTKEVAAGNPEKIMSLVGQWEAEIQKYER